MEKAEDEVGMYFDSHNHLLDYQQTKQVHEMLAEAEKDGVRYCVPNTTREAEYKSMLQLSSNYPFKSQVRLEEKRIQIIPSFGLHPCFLYHQADNKNWRSKLEQILSINPMFGIGEIGLDYRKPTLEKNTKEDQLPIFTEQLEMSFLMNRSVTVHCVYAHGQMLKIFKEYNKMFEDYSRIKEKQAKIALSERQMLLGSLYQRNPIIMHSYGGSKQITKSLVKLKYLNIFFSLSLKRAEEVCTVIPIEQLILQTDAPYQTDVKILQQMKIVPEDMNQESVKALEKKNHVSYVRGNLCLNKFYGLDQVTFANTMFKNSLRAFRLKF